MPVTCLVLNETPLGDSAEKLVDALMERAEISYETRVICAETNGRTKKAEYLAWYEENAGDLAQYDKVLALGGTARAAVLGETARSTLDVKGRGEMVGDTYMVTTIRPKDVFIDPNWFRDLERDIRKLKRNSASVQPQPVWNARRGSFEMPPGLLSYETARNTKHAIELLEWISEASVLSCDIETTGFAPGDADILAIGFGALTEDGVGGESVLLPAPVLTSGNIHRILKDFFARYPGLLVFHNLKFDTRHLLKADYLKRYNNVTDTMLIHYALDERPIGKYRAHGLKDLARVYFDSPEYGISMDDWLENNSDPFRKGPADFTMGDRQLLDYLNFDCYYTNRLYRALEQEVDVANEEYELAGNGLWDLVDKVLVPGTTMIAEIENRGIKLDLAHFQGLRKTLDSRIAQSLEEIRDVVGDLADSGQTKAEPDKFNPGSPKQLGDLLYKDYGLRPPIVKKSGGSTSKDALIKLRRQAQEKAPEVIPLIDKILVMRNSTKTARTFVDNLLKRCDDDGRLRTELGLTNTITGRLASQKPNLQNIPGTMASNFEIRAGFVASPGFKFIEADYSQLELRVGASYSEDPKLCEAFQNGEDIHTRVGQELWGKTELDRRERMMAKMLNFGIFFGRGPKSIADGREMEYLLEQGEAKWTEGEVKKYYEKYKARFRQLFAWCSGQHALVQQQGFVVSPTQRVRRFPFIHQKFLGLFQRQAVNAPVQSFASDLTLMAAIRLHEQFDPDNARILLLVHDSILFEVREEKVDEILPLIEHEMTARERVGEWPGVNWDKVPLAIDTKVSDRWGA